MGGALISPLCLFYGVDSCVISKINTPRKGGRAGGSKTKVRRVHFLQPRGLGSCMTQEAILTELLQFSLFFLVKKIVDCDGDSVCHTEKEGLQRCPLSFLAGTTPPDSRHAKFVTFFDLL